MDTGVSDVAPFVIGDEGYRVLYGGRGQGVAAAPSVNAACTSGLPGDCVGSAGTSGAGARVLVREEAGSVSARIYYPDALIRQLEDRPPGRGLTDANIDAFSIFVEELDHFLLLAERVRLARPVTLLELEMHANVTKYLVCALFLGAERGRGKKAPLADEDRVWLLWHLFEKITFAEPDPQVQSRYRAAARFARRFLGGLDETSSPAARLERLRLIFPFDGQCREAADCIDRIRRGREHFLKHLVFLQKL
jgi:hypothetical protein